MKTFRIKDHYQEEFGEYVLGPKELGNRVGYMVLGELEPGVSRELSPGNGHEEIVLVIGGEARLEGADGIVSKGSAFYLPSGGSAVITAGDNGCTYVSAGAHVVDHGH